MAKKETLGCSYKLSGRARCRLNIQGDGRSCHEVGYNKMTGNEINTCAQLYAESLPKLYSGGVPENPSSYPGDTGTDYMKLAESRRLELFETDQPDHPRDNI